MGGAKFYRNQKVSRAAVGLKYGHAHLGGTKGCTSTPRSGDPMHRPARPPCPSGRGVIDTVIRS